MIAVIHWPPPEVRDRLRRATAAVLDRPLSAFGAPPALLPLFAAGEGPQPSSSNAIGQPIPPSRSAALADVLNERQRAIEKFGHTVEADLRHPVIRLPKVAMVSLQDAIDDLRRGTAHRANARLRLVRATAILFAAIDRLDAETPSTTETGEVA